MVISFFLSAACSVLVKCVYFCAVSVRQPFITMKMTPKKYGEYTIGFGTKLYRIYMKQHDLTFEKQKMEEKKKREYGFRAQIHANDELSANLPHNGKLHHQLISGGVF